MQNKKLFSINKKSFVQAVVVGALLIAVLIFFYWQKAHSDYYISTQDKLLIVCSSIVITLLTMVNIRDNKILGYISDFACIGMCPVLLFRMLEPMVNSMDTIKSSTCQINELLLLTVLLLLYSFTSNAFIAVLVGGIAIYFYYLIDYFVAQFRGTPVLFSDIKSIKTALGVAGAYRYTLNNRIFVTIYVVILLATVAAFFGVKKKTRERVVLFLITATLGISILYTLICTEYLDKNGYSNAAFLPAYSAKDNGLLLYDILALKSSKIMTPEGYSTEEVERIIERAFSNSKTIEKTVMPNIIVVMNESFTDVDYLKEVETSEPTIPKFKELCKNSISGTLISSILGGNTPNSEFECLTGCTMGFLPSGIVAYQRVIDRPYSTLATQLKTLGYSTEAVHLYNPTYFDRQRVYQLLGIDQFTSEKNYSRDEIIVDYLRDYATDHSTFELIEKQFEKRTGKSFIFGVTIQNHGGYWTGIRDIELVGQYSGYANEYLSILKITDDAFADFIDYFSNVDEPTVVVMYGDHQPYLFDDDYVNIWEGCDYSKEEKRYMQAKTPFLIWANYDIGQKDMGEMSINYLGPTIMQAAGLPMSEWFEFLLRLKEDVPVVSAIGYVDKEGNHFSDYRGSKYEEEIREYEFLQYNYLRGSVKPEFYSN